MDQGLTTLEAEERLKKFGYNELPSRKENLLEKVKEVLTEPMILLLLAGSGLYFLLGDQNDAIPLLLSVVAIILIDVYEEHKTGRALEALKQIGSPKAIVLRSGETSRISSREVVVGDILILSEGDRVATDTEILESINLAIDEAMLTGESVPVPKVAGAKAYMGTLVTAGHGMAKVTAIGVTTEMGKIGKSLEEIKIEASPAKQEAEGLARTLALWGLSLCFLLLVYYGIKNGDWIRGLLAGITLAMSLLPEEIPIILVIFTILGAFRMSKKRVLAKRSSVIETLGATTVICLDKTGTITQNKMQIERLYAHGKTADVTSGGIPENFYDLVKFGVLASRKSAVDPMEKAIRDLSDQVWGTKKLFEDWKHLAENPLTDKVLAVSEIWQDPSDGQIIAIKGAPEAVVELCHLNPFEAETVLATSSRMAEDGLRVLAVAKNDHVTPEFLGLLGFSDPIRPAIKSALRECYTAGVRVVIITGDHPETARKIATEVGLKQGQKLMLGPALKDLDEVELEKVVASHNVFARISPAQKLLIITALKNRGEVVTMIGDGINDAPAIKAANIGVAMGEHGTDVAREAAALVLLDDNFTAVVEAIRLGRRIFDNIRKALSYVLAMHLPIAGMATIPVFLGFPPVFFPVHIALMELFTDPACSIVFESQPEEANVMNRPPRLLTDRLFNRRTFLIGLLQGVLALIFTFLTFWTASGLGFDEAKSRTLTLLTLLTINIGLVVVNRSWNKVSLCNLWYFDPALTVFLVISISFIFLVPNLTPTQAFLKLGPVPFNYQLLSILTGITATGGFWIIKKLLYWRHS